VKILSKKTSGGLFIQFEIHSPGETEIDQLMTEPPGVLYQGLVDLEDVMRRSGEICDSPDTGFQERIEPMSDTSYVSGGYFEARDEAASETLIERLGQVLKAADVDVEYL